MILVTADGQPLQLLAIDESGVLVAKGYLDVDFIPTGPGPHIINDVRFIARRDDRSDQERERDDLMRTAITDDSVQTG